MKLLLSLVLLALTEAFVPVQHTVVRPNIGRRQQSIKMAEAGGKGLNRYDVIRSAGVGLGLGLLIPSLGSGNMAAQAAEGGPVAVLGARGRTGRLIVRQLLGMGTSVRAVSHSGFTYDPSEIEGLSGSIEYAQGDVTKPETLPAVVSGTSAVIFASSASKGGGNAQQVDYIGVENVAKACIDAKVPRLVIISSGAVSRPDSLGFKITNVFGNIMVYKFKGENRLRELYASAPAGVTYTIVRPGGLSSDPPKGVKEIEVNQGDFIIGEISRADVADACVNCILSKDAENATFEVFEAGRRYPLQFGFRSKSGNEHRGDSWPAVFAGLKSDQELGIVPKA